MSEKKGMTKERQLLDTLRELIQTEEDVAKCERAYSTKSNESYISTKIAEIKAYLEKQARRYNKANNKINTIAQKYEGFIKQEKERYEAKRNMIFAEKETCQVAEVESIALFKKSMSKLKELKGSRAYETIVGFRSEISGYEQEGRKKKAVKKEEEFKLYKADLKDRIKALEAEISGLTQANQMDNDSERKLIRAEEIEKASKRLKKVQKLDFCAELDTKMQNLQSNILTCRLKIRDKKSELKKCDKSFEKTVDGLKLQENAEKARANKQSVGERMLGRVYSAISGNEHSTFTFDSVLKKAKKAKNKALKSLKEFFLEEIPEEEQINKKAKTAKEGISIAE